MKTRCKACPCDPSVPCGGLTEEFAFFCEWAASGDSVKLQHVANRSRIANGETIKQAVQLEPRAENSTVQRNRLLITLAKECPYRENTSSCGCGVSKCHAARGSSRIDPQAANMQDCLDCVLTLLPDHFASV